MVPNSLTDSIQKKRLGGLSGLTVGEVKKALLPLYGESVSHY